MVFDSPIINAHLNPDYVCLADCPATARAFYDRGKPGIIGLLTDETRRVGMMLDDFNAHARTRSLYDRGHEAEVTAAVSALLEPVFAPSSVTLCRPSEDGRGWGDPPHLDNSTIALFAGNERQVEFSTLPPMDDRALYALDAGGRTDAQLETEWGNSYATYDPLFARHAPVSFLRCTLAILIAVPQVNHLHPLATAHRVPRQLKANETRGYIAKAFA